ncbi:MAG: dihydrodipicolinate synthase family protein, partial [Armatimonadetes bacterium]|nr:dihydrodipicolinate synthase family protein [Armatimonadota bacterium]
ASLALPPFYFRPASDDGIAAWFRELLDASELPCILYNIPRATGFTFPRPLVEDIFRHQNAAGIKDSSGDAAILDEYLSLGKPVFVGDEKLISHCLANGGAGTISGLANSFPRLVSRLVHERSEVLQTLVDEAVANVKCHQQPAVHKWVLEMKGLPGGRVRAPLDPLPDDSKAQVKEFVERFGF